MFDRMYKSANNGNKCLERTQRGQGRVVNGMSTKTATSESLLHETGLDRRLSGWLPPSGDTFSYSLCAFCDRNGANGVRTADARAAAAPAFETSSPRRQGDG